MASPPNVESTPSPAVSSLRSRFEKLALDTSQTSLPKHHNANGRDLLLPQPGSPRPRALSNPDEMSTSHHHHSLSSSISSDIRVPAKRPPPPPPPARSSKQLVSPGVSPLLRPVPIPASGYASDASGSSASPARLPHRRPGSIPVIHLDDSPPGSPPGGGVAAIMHNKFTTSPPPFRSNGTPRITSQPNLLSSPSPPAVPPRPSKLSPPRPPSRTRLLSSAETSPTIMPSDSPSVRIHGPFSDDESESGAASKSISQINSSPYTRPYADSDSLISFDTLDPPSSNSSRFSSESDVSTSHASSLPLPPRPAPPRPPPRHRSTIQQSAQVESPSSASSTQSNLVPPPLPSRRPLPAEDHRGAPPRAPTRNFSMLSDPDTHAGSSSAPPNLDRKPPAQRLPPPPTRTIAPGDKLPPPRRMPSDESDESGAEDEDLKAKVADSMPDTSRSSRRPPTISPHAYSAADIPVPAHQGLVATAGHIVVVAAHGHVRIFDLSVADSPLWTHDARTLGLSKDLRATCLEFRSGNHTIDKGRFLWLGTKDGHLFELDLSDGSIAGNRLSAHTHAVTHILRYGNAMVTLDDGGKALVFVPEVGADPHLASTPSRVARIADKQEFAQILAGKLWTSAREAANSGSGGASRGPIVRVYDIFVHAGAGKSLLPTEHVGAVTSGTVLPSQPHAIYLGHEGGFVSIWGVGEDGMPACIEVVRVSVSDVLSLEGVNDRLWAGGRKGTIAAYDVVQRPWVMTNMWNAHGGLPLQKISIDPYSIDRLGRLVVVSVGRDERMRFWDGLLGCDWIDQELIRRESSFSSFRDLNVLVVSWNVDASKPDALTGSPANLNFFEDVLNSVDSPDIIVFGFQELIDLESRKMAAKTVLLGGKKKAGDGSISEKVSSSYKRWYDKLVLAVRLAMPPETPYTVIHTESLVGLFSCIFIKNGERVSLRNVAVATVKRGMGGRYGNKGGIVARMIVDDSSVCFINCHLAAGQHHVRQRNGDIAAIVEQKDVFPEDVTEGNTAYVGGGDGSMVLDHEIVFVNGDMNYRIDQRRDTVISAIKAGDLRSLLPHDQLRKEMKANPGFRLRAFMEGPLEFAPTYKYDRRSSTYDSSEKRRTPAWCDRVLWRAQEPTRVQQINYQRYEADVSDHRPISAGFRMTVKSVRHDERAAAKKDVEQLWVEQERHLLARVREFYTTQMVI